MTISVWVMTNDHLMGLKVKVRCQKSRSKLQKSKCDWLDLKRGQFCVCVSGISTEPIEMLETHTLTDGRDQHALRLAMPNAKCKHPSSAVELASSRIYFRSLTPMHGRLAPLVWIGHKRGSRKEWPYQSNPNLHCTLGFEGFLLL